jgi:hypothetical protein
MDIWSILRTFDILFHGHLLYFVVILSIFPRFGILYQEKNLATLVFIPNFAASTADKYIETPKRRHRLEETRFPFAIEI